MRYEEAVAPLELGEGSKYVLAIHGFTGSPYEMRELAQYLAAQGFHVIALRLPGHGQTKEELLKIRFQDWWNEIKKNIEYIKERNSSHIFVTGLSLGGTLTLYTAAQYPEITAIATICTPIYVKKSYTLMFPIAKRFLTYVGTQNYLYFDVQDQNLIKDPIFQEQSKRYDKEVIPVYESIFNLFKDIRNHQMSKIRQPITVFQARKDRTVLPNNGSYILEHVATKPEEKSLVWLENSGHIATMDLDKEQLFSEMANFFKKFSH